MSNRVVIPKALFSWPGPVWMGAYISKLVKAFHEAGIKSAVYLDRKKWSGGILLDVAGGVIVGRDYDPGFPMLFRLHNNAHKQFNLIGYSYGSIISAQLAVKYAKKGSRVDNLVLIGSPISEQFLKMLRNMKTIKKVIVINLDEHGDPIFAGMGVFDLMTATPKIGNQMFESTGHFYYAEKGKEGDKRRKELADKLYTLGLR